MNKEAFHRLSGKEVFSKVMGKVKVGEIDNNRARRAFEDWLTNNGYVLTDNVGWAKKDELDEMGVYQDTSGVWRFFTEVVFFEKKYGKNTIEVATEVPVRYENWCAKKKQERENKEYQKEENINLFNQAKEILGGEEV